MIVRGMKLFIHSRVARIRQIFPNYALFFLQYWVTSAVTFVNWEGHLVSLYWWYAVEVELLILCVLVTMLHSYHLLQCYIRYHVWYIISIFHKMCKCYVYRHVVAILHLSSCFVHKYSTQDMQIVFANIHSSLLIYMFCVHPYSPGLHNCHAVVLVE